MSGTDYDQVDLLDSRHVLDYSEDPRELFEASIGADAGQVRALQETELATPLATTRSRILPEDLDAEDVDHRINQLNLTVCPSWIGENIYISNIQSAHTYLYDGGVRDDCVQWPRIKYMLSIVDCTEGQKMKWEQSAKEKGIILKVMRLRDSQQTNMLGYFPEICKFIHDAVNECDDTSNGILVHCRKGMSRSPTAIIAYLMWRFHFNTLQGFDYVRKYREVVWPNPGFWDQLLQWDVMDCDLLQSTDRDKIRGEYVVYRLDHHLKGGDDGAPDEEAMKEIPRPLKTG